MFDITVYLKTIEHAKGAEPSDLKAFKIDDADGLAECIGFNSHVINKVDYFVELGLHVQLVELSDLQDALKHCHTNISEALEKISQNASISAKSKREQEKAIRKEVWQKLRDEFFKKWSGSIAVIERLYRKTSRASDEDPSYSLLIVCKNITDVRMLDTLTVQLNGQCGMVKDVQVCNTEHLGQFLLS